MGLLNKLSHAQRISLAILVTMTAVGLLEIAHFSRGSSIPLEVGYFAVPVAVALALFRTLRERAVAFVMLTVAGFLAAAAAIVFYLTP